MSEDLKKLMEELSNVLGEVVRDSSRIRGLLRKIEEKGADANLTLAIILGIKDKRTEIQKIVYGSEQVTERKSSVRRISAFDRRFLRALRIKLPD